MTAEREANGNELAEVERAPGWRADLYHYKTRTLDIARQRDASPYSLDVQRTVWDERLAALYPGMTVFHVDEIVTLRRTLAEVLRGMPGKRKLLRHVCGAAPASPETVCAVRQDVETLPAVRMLLQRVSQLPITGVSELSETPSPMGRCDGSNEEILVDGLQLGSDRM